MDSTPTVVDEVDVEGTVEDDSDDVTWLHKEFHFIGSLAFHGFSWKPRSSFVYFLYGE